MTNKILFGVIGVLLASIANVGVAVAQEELFHSPGEDDRQSLSDSQVQEISDDSLDLKDDSDDDSNRGQVSISGSKSDDDEWEDEDENEDEDEDEDEDSDDDSRSSRTSSTPASSGQSTVVAQAAASAPATSAKTYTMAEVSAHNSTSSCYTVVSGSVYDVTGFISRHPGGASAVLSLCGVDGSSAFIDQHSGERRPANELASFKIGTLVN